MKTETETYKKNEVIHMEGLFSGNLLTYVWDGKNIIVETLTHNNTRRLTIGNLWTTLEDAINHINKHGTDVTQVCLASSVLVD